MKDRHGVWSTYTRQLPPKLEWRIEGPFCGTCNRPVIKTKNGHWRHLPVKVPAQEVES
jgi:hypothetical protein